MLVVVGVILQYVQNGCRVGTVAEIAPVLLMGSWVLLLGQISKIIDAVGAFGILGESQCLADVVVRAFEVLCSSLCMYISIYDDFN